MSVVLSTVPAQALRADVAVVPGEQEFSFGNADFERIRQLIYQRAGISLHAGKQAMVYSRLSRRPKKACRRCLKQVEGILSSICFQTLPPKQWPGLASS